MTRNTRKYTLNISALKSDSHVDGPQNVLVAHSYGSAADRAMRHASRHALAHSLPLLALIYHNASEFEQSDALRFLLRAAGCELL